MEENHPDAGWVASDSLGCWGISTVHTETEIRADRGSIMESPETQRTAGSNPEVSGVIVELGQLGSGAVISEKGMSQLFRRHPTSVKRAVERGEIPPPFRLFGRNTWTAGALVRHFEGLLEDAAKEAEEMKSKIRKLSP